MCPKIFDSGHVCSQPFDIEFVRSNFCFAHSSEKNNEFHNSSSPSLASLSSSSSSSSSSSLSAATLSEKSKRNLSCEGIFFSRVPSEAGGFREVMETASAGDAQIELKDGKVKVTRRNIQTEKAMENETVTGAENVDVGIIISTRKHP